MDVHIYEKKTGKYLRTVRDVKVGGIIDIEDDPSKLHFEYEEQPKSIWPEGSEL